MLAAWRCWKCADIGYRVGGTRWEKPPTDASTCRALHYQDRHSAIARPSMDGLLILCSINTRLTTCSDGLPWYHLVSIATLHLAGIRNMLESLVPGFRRTVCPERVRSSPAPVVIPMPKPYYTFV